MNESSLPVIDWEQHASASTPEMDMGRELLQLFLQQLPELETKLQTAMLQQDQAELRAVLHRMQGACAYCGLPQLREITAQCGGLLRQGQTLTETHYQQVTTAIATIKAELAQHGIKQS